MSTESGGLMKGKGLALMAVGLILFGISIYMTITGWPLNTTDHVGASVVWFDVYLTKDDGTKFTAAVAVKAEPGKHMAFAEAEGDYRYNLIVCENDPESDNPCGPHGPEPDKFGAAPE